MMKPFAYNLRDRVRPEYFFWGALLLSLSLLFGGGAPPAVADEATPSAPVASESAFTHLSLEAKAFSVYDMKTGRDLFADNADAVLPLASVAKVMTAATALSLIPETTLVTISAEAVGQEGDSHFFVGEQWVLRDLVRFMLLESSNDAAYAVAESVGSIATSTEDRALGRAFFIETLNARAQAMGLVATHFENESGLDLDEARVGAASTARETTIFFADALKRFPTAFTATTLNDLQLPAANGVLREARNTNRDTDKLPLLLASKTGFTDLAGGNLVIAFDADFGHPIVIAVLGSTEKGRFSDVEKLVWATLTELSRH